MPWTEPKSWTNVVVSRDDLNTHLRDNLLMIKYPETKVYRIRDRADYSTSSTSFVDIDATEGNLLHTVETIGEGTGNSSELFVGFHASLYAATVIAVYFRILLDGVAQNADDGLLNVWTVGTGGPTGGVIPFGFLVPLVAVAPGEHEVKLQWKVSGGTAYLLAGQTSGRKTEGQFWVREMS